MDVQRIAAFTHDGQGGNPAGVAIADSLPSVPDMQRIAAEIGYSETAFAAAVDGTSQFRVRYFAPESEVPFCGHATIALGAALGRRFGEGRYGLTLNDFQITVDARQDGGDMTATLVSPPTGNRPAPDSLKTDALALFGLTEADLDPQRGPVIAEAGATHLMLFLTDRARLATMDYDLVAGRELMRRHGLVTIALLVQDGERLFHARNAFASGGVLEDPATGAAAAALGGLLRDTDVLNGGRLTVLQGFDMGRPSELIVTLTEGVGSPVSVTGRASGIVG